MTCTYEIHELSRRRMRIRVSTPETPRRRYWLLWDGEQVREGSHTRAMRERAPTSLSWLLRALGEQWTRERMAQALERLS